MVSNRQGYFYGANFTTGDSTSTGKLFHSLDGFLFAVKETNGFDSIATST